MGFLEEYIKLEELGKGGFATVYKVKHIELGYVRAIRVLNELIDSEQSKVYQKFMRECKVLLRLGNGNHRNIVHIYQPRFLEHHAMVEMDCIDGCNLSNYLEANENFLPAKEVLRMVEEMSDALAYCHEDIYKFCMDRDADNLQDDPNDGSKVLMDEETRQRLIDKYKVIHNDIHSGNIMRRDDGSFVLLDFGLAITGTDDVRNSSRHENGAIEYRAPEKWENDSLLTEQSDVYSFGVVMYEYLAGRVPFKFDKENSNKIKASFDLSEAHRLESPPSIFEIRKDFYEKKFPDKKYKQDYPDWLEEAILKCLEKDPDKRFKNCKELHMFVMNHLNVEVNMSDNEELQELRDEKNSWLVAFNKMHDKVKALQDNLYEKEVLIRGLKKELKNQGSVDPMNSNNSNNSANIDNLYKRMNSLLKDNQDLRKIINQKNDEIKQRDDSIDNLQQTVMTMTKKKRSKLWMWIVIVVMTIATAVLGYLSFNDKDSDKGNEPLKMNNEAPTVNVEAADVSPASEW